MQASKRSIFPTVLLGGGVTLVALLLGMLLGAGGGVFAVLVVAGLLLLLAAAFFWNQSVQSLGRALFWLQILLFYSLGLVFGVSRFSLNGGWQVLIYAGAIFGCWMVGRAWLRGWLLASALFLLAYLLLTLTSLGFAPSVAWKATAYQLLSNLKLFALFGFLFMLSSWGDVEQSIRKTTPLFVLICAAALILQWGSPSAYLTVFSGFRLPVESTFVLPSPGIGIFHHPSILAGVSAALACFYLARFFDSRRRTDLFLFIGLVLLLFASNQRQEIFAFFIASATIYFFLSRSSLFVRGAVLSALVIVAVGLFSVLFWESIARELPQWGIGTWRRSVIPRYQLYEGAWTLAREYFPFGRGLGAYGGVGAMKYDLSAYFQLGLASEWWWPNYNHYLLDAYWPNAIGEGGYFGVLFMGLHYACLLLYFLVRGARAALRETQRAWIVAAAALLWLMATTPTSPGFQEIVILYFPAAFWVIAERLSEKEKV